MKRVNFRYKLYDRWVDYNNYILISNLEEYQEYLKFDNIRFDLAEKEIKEQISLIGHGVSKLTNISTLFVDTLETDEYVNTFLANLNILKAKNLTNQTKLLSKGLILAINENNGYFYIDKEKDEYEILDSIELYNIEDIKISRWDGGTHYYAKVGKFDVQDKEGNVKWDYREKAMYEAYKFLKEINNIK